MAVLATAPADRRSSTVAADLVDLRAVRDALADALAALGWTPEEAFRVLVCADEAMANALSHGSVAGRPIDIRFDVRQERVLLVGDARARGATMPATPMVPAESSEHGRGLILMQALADELRLWRRPTGTLVALAFRPESSRAAERDAR